MGLDITRFALDKRVIASAIFLLFALWGASTYFSLPRAEDPGFTVRQAVIITQFPGASAKRVEELVTDPLEEGLQQLVGLDYVRSVSRPGQSVVIVAAEETLEDVPAFWDEMRERVQEQSRALPEEVIGPFVNDDFGDVFGTLLALTGDGFNLAELEDVAEELRRQILRLPDVAKVEIVGVAERRIHLEYDEARLAELGIGAEQIARQLRGQNIVRPSGRVLSSEQVFEIETEGSYESLEELGATLIDVGRRSFPLEQLVTIEQGYDDDPPAPTMSFTGRPALGLAISMVPDGKLTRLGPRVREFAERATQELPLGLELHVASYQAAVVEQAVNGFVGNLVQSVVIVLVVMLVALGLRTGLIVGAMVPMTILVALSVMGVMGIGLNKMSLTALIIALGLLVDNGIVISESILVKRDEGEGLVQAGIDTARELRVPLLISSITTVAALLPTYLAESTTGEYTAPIAEVVAIALLASWLLSLTFVPLCCVVFMGQGGHAAPKPKGERSKFQIRYRSALETTVRRRWFALAGFVGLFVFSAWLMGRVPQQFFPGKEWPQLTIALELPEGTPRLRTEQVVKDIESFFAERFVAEDWSEDRASEKVAGAAERTEEVGLVSWSAFVGEGAPRFILGYAPEQPRENYAYFIVNVEHPAVVAEVVDAIEAYLRERFPEAVARVRPLRNGPPLDYPVEIRLSGDDIGALRRAVDATESQLRSIEGLARIGNDWGPDRARVRVDVDPVRLSAAGLTHAEVADSLDTALRGRPLTVFRDGRDIVPIELRRQDAPRATVEDIRQISVFRQRDGASVPLLQVAEVELDFEPPVVRRRDRQRTITVRADIAPDAPRSVTAFSVAEQMRKKLEEAEAGWPFGFGWAFGGEVESSGKANASIQAKQPIALLIIVFCLIFQFNTVREPLIVLLTLPFAITGVAMGLYLTQKPFGFMALLGVIALFGIVINNAIVLLDRVQIEIAEGRTKMDALLEASERRFRPILLTTATTVAGLIPLALFGGPLFSPMAVALMSGLLVSTILTLGLVPVLYSILHRVARPSRAGTAALLAGLLGGFPGAAEARPIDADEAARLAAERALEYRSAQAEKASAEAQRDATIMRYLPRLSGSASYTRLSDLTQPSLFGDGGTLVVTQAANPPLALEDLAPLPAGGGSFPVILNQVAFSGTLSIPISRYVFEIANALEAVDAGVRAAALREDAARVQAAARARLAYYGFAGTVLQVDVFEQRLEEAQERLRVSAARLDAGRAAETEVLEAESALARTELALARARREVKTAEEALRKATLDPAGTAYELPDTATEPAFIAPPEPEPARALFAEALERRIEPRRIEATLRAFAAREGLTWAEGLPALEGFGSVLAAQPNPRFIPNREELDTTWELGIRLRWAPNDLLVSLAEARQVAAETDQLRIQLEGLELDIREAVVSAREQVIEARASVDSARKGVVSAEAAYARRKLTYEEGAATLLDLLQSESALLAAQLDGIRARIQAQVATVRLDNATGRDVASVLGLE